jgi:hypothetical protein
MADGFEIARLMRRCGLAVLIVVGFAACGGDEDASAVQETTTTVVTDETVPSVTTSTTVDVRPVGRCDIRYQLDTRVASAFVLGDGQGNGVIETAEGDVSSFPRENGQGSGVVVIDITYADGTTSGNIEGYSFGYPSAASVDAGVSASGADPVSCEVTGYRPGPSHLDATDNDGDGWPDGWSG